MEGLSIIIPAYNEESRIRPTLEAYHEFFSKRFKNLEIIVVTDGSTDRTVEIVREMGKQYKGVRILHFKQRLGKGGAVFEGFKAAKFGTVGFTDADAAVTPYEYNKLLFGIEDYDCIAGSRYAKGAIQVKLQPLSVRIASRVFNLLVNLLFGLGMRDTQCGAKVFRRETVLKVMPKMVTKDFSFDVELLWRINAIGRIKEEPLIWEHKEHASKSSLKNSPKMLKSILKARLSGL